MYIGSDAEKCNYHYTGDKCLDQQHPRISECSSSHIFILLQLTLEKMNDEFLLRCVACIHTFAKPIIQTATRRQHRIKKIIRLPCLIVSVFAFHHASYWFSGLALLAVVYMGNKKTKSPTSAQGTQY